MKTERIVTKHWRGQQSDKAKWIILNSSQMWADRNLKSEEPVSQESNRSYKLKLLKQKSEVSREQETVKSMVLGKAGEINRILKVMAGSESNSFKNLKLWHSWVETLKKLWAQGSEWFSLFTLFSTSCCRHVARDHRCVITDRMIRDWKVHCVPDWSKDRSVTITRSSSTLKVPSRQFIPLCLLIPPLYLTMYKGKFWSLPAICLQSINDLGKSWVSQAT